MRLFDKEIICSSRSDEFEFYFLGDIHVNSLGFADKHFVRFVQHIKETPNAYWFGGGDYCEWIMIDDKRFDIKALPDKYFEDGAEKAKAKLSDILGTQETELVDMLEPIRDKCLGLIEGNHERTMRNSKHIDVLSHLCDRLCVPNLTGTTMGRLFFKRSTGAVKTVKLAITHGTGGGRTAGAEPNHLTRLANQFDAEIICRGHSHTFCILPPIVQVSLPQSGKLPPECTQKEKRVGNWGCWMKSYPVGESGYAEVANYPPRPLSTIKVVIKPFFGDKLEIQMLELPLA